MPSHDGPITKLPLFTQVEGLAKLPGQDSSTHYAVISRLEPRPKGDGGRGYVVELLGGRRVRVLAWLSAGGRAFACDAPTAEPFAGDPIVSFALDPDRPGRGFGYLRPHDGDKPTTIAHFVQREGDGKVTLSRATRDLGSYADGFYDVGIALSTLFLACYHLPLQRGEELVTRTVEQVLDDLLRASYPDTLDALMYRGTAGENGRGPSPFERYAARSLERAGAEHVRAIAVAHSIELRRLGSTHMFWTSFDADELTADERDTLLAVEAVLNRLVLLARAFEVEHGVPARVNDLDEAGWERMATATLTSFIDAVPECLRACDEPNPFMRLDGVAAARGGEWDVRTRFALAAESLRLPFRLEYRFACDARGGVLAVDCALPAVNAFPQADEIARGQAQATYTVRLSALLAAVAFGSGVGLVRALVTCRGGDLSGPVLSAMAFGRQRFIMGTVPCLQAGDFTRVEAPASDLLAQVGCEECNIELSSVGALTPVKPIACSLPERLIPTGRDARPLPIDLAERLRADTVADLDVYGTDDDTLSGRYDEALKLIDTGDVQTAIGMLQDIIDTYEAAVALQGDERRPLYCSNMVGRVLVDRVSALEERFRKVPDSAYGARSVLTRIYREMGNWELAEQYAREMIDMAPTTVAPYHAQAMVFIAQDRFADAVEPLVTVLRFASERLDIAAVYYRLAFALWQAGDAKTGLACYAIVNPYSHFGSSAKEEAEDLMRGAGIGHMPTRDEARAQLRAAGIPIAPLDRLCEDILHVAARLIDEGLFDAAIPLVHSLTHLDVGPNGADVLAVVSASLRA